MYYDLIASLPHLPYFQRAQRSPITRLRLDQRLRLLRPVHAEQLARARTLVGWRPDRLLGKSDAAYVAEYAALLALPVERPLEEYVAFRMDQQMLVAALRWSARGSRQRAVHCRGCTMGSPSRGIGMSPSSAWGTCIRAVRRVICWQPAMRALNDC
jgi:hypothetical protein